MNFIHRMIPCRKKVKKSLAKKQKPKSGKRNTVKSRQKKEARDIANSAHYN